MLEMAGTAGLLEMAGIIWKWLHMAGFAGNCWKALKMDGMWTSHKFPL